MYNHFEFLVVGSNNRQGTAIRRCDFTIVVIVPAWESCEGLYFKECISSLASSAVVERLTSCQEVEDGFVSHDEVRGLACIRLA